MKYLIAANRTIQVFLGTNFFFYIILLLFATSSVWVATTSLYPMAFDEDFHLGLIKIYASSWLPYGIEHTRDMATYGSATADPSYLFHYILSMPYRLFVALGMSETTTVVLLRLINICFVVLSLWIYRKALLAANISKALIHTVLAFFCLIPILPVMAGQINYDNLLLVMIALLFWLLTIITNFARAHDTLPALQTWLLGGVLLVAMPIKYAFLPVALGTVIWLGIIVIRNSRVTSFKKQYFHFLTATKTMSRPVKIGLAAFFILGSFFASDYIVNYVEYGHPIPKCDVVFDEEACKSYGPWNRNFYLKKALSDSFHPISLPHYIVMEWVPGMAERTTFAVAGPTNDHQTKPPLPIPISMVAAIAILGILSLLIFIRKLYTHEFIQMVFVLCFVYVVSLIWKLYGSYTMTGEPVAINGRYLLPFLPLVGAVFGVSILKAATSLRLTRWLPSIATLFFIALLTQGGGIGTYIERGESTWFWPGWGQTSHQVLKSASSSFIIK